MSMMGNAPDGDGHLDTAYKKSLGEAEGTIKVFNSFRIYTFIKDAGIG